MKKTEIHICEKCNRILSHRVRGKIMFLVCKNCGYEKKFAKLIYFDEMSDK
jgi:DNA-directed RNA polymerase subunit M/transcription elongation factor TFIIS